MQNVTNNVVYEIGLLYVVCLKLIKTRFCFFVHGIFGRMCL